MLPLGARDLWRAHPELFPSKARAKDALDAAKDHPMGAGLNGGRNHIILFGIPPHLIRTATYRRAGQLGHASRVIYDSTRHSDPRAALSKLLGEEIIQFDVMPAEAPPAPAPSPTAKE